MATEVDSPNTPKHINIGPDCMFPFSIKGGVPGGTAIVYLEYEGQGRNYVTSKVFGPSGKLDFCIETGRPYISQTVFGEIVGEAGQVITRAIDPILMTFEEVFINLYNKPGTTQAVRDIANATDVAKLDGSSGGLRGYADNIRFNGVLSNVYDPNLVVGSDGFTPINKYTIEEKKGTTIDAEGVALTQAGPCCPCAKGGANGVTPGGNNATGDPTLSTSLAIMASRGLPLIFSTTHCANERFKGPWGWYRSLGIYRRLLEQNPVLYNGHVSIFRQDATRVSYVNKVTYYEAAAGSYDSLVKTALGWFEKTKEGIYYEYNAHGNLKRVIDPNRNQHYYLYDDNTSSQRLVEIKATKGLRPYFYYNDPAGDTTLNTRIALRDPTDSSKNKYVYFQYDASGYMTKAVGPEGCHWYYEYDKAGIPPYNQPGKIKQITDPDGYTTYYVFQTSG